MKKVVITICVLVGIAIIAVALMHTMRPQAVHLERVIPQGAVIYARSSNIENNWEQFKKGRLYRALSSIDLEEVFERSGVPERKFTLYKNMVTEYFDEIAELKLAQYFGDEVAVAVYPVEIIDAADLKDPSYIASKVIVATKLRKGARIGELASEIYRKLGKELITTSTQHSKYTITQIELAQGLSLCFAEINDIAFIGVGTAGITRCLDVVDKKEKSLFEESAYRTVAAKLPREADGLTYLNFESLVSLLKEVENIASEQGASQQDREKLSRSFDAFSGFKALAASSQVGEHHEQKAIVSYDENALDPTVRSAYSFKPGKNRTLSFTPKDVLTYQWSNNFDLGASLESILSQEHSAATNPNVPSPEMILQNIENTIGISVDELTDALGNEIGGYLHDFDANGPLPLPRFVLFIKVNDKAQIEGVLNNLLSQASLPLQSQEYQNTTIKYLSIPFVAGIQPSYCFLDDYLLIASSRTLLEKSLDVRSTTAGSLLNDKDFKAFAAGTSNYVSLVRLARLLDDVERIVEWGSNWYSLVSSRQKSFQMGNAEAFQEARMRIEEMEKELKAKEDELATLAQNLAASSPEEDRLLKVEFDEKEKEVNSFREDVHKRSEQLNELSKNASAKRADPELIRFYINSVAYPIMDGLKSYETISSKSVIADGMVETTTITTIAE